LTGSEGKDSSSSRDPVWSVNTRLSILQDTANFYKNGGSLLQSKTHTSLTASAATAILPASIELPSAPGQAPSVETPPPQRGQITPVYINPLEQSRVEISEPSVEQRAPVQDPTPVGVPTAKYAHRLLRLKKKKMKVHRRKRLWKRMWSVWKKKFFGRERKREIEFRSKLIEAVKEAKKFDAANYTQAYLADYKYEFVPLTYKGKRKHRSVVLELLEKEKQDKLRKELDGTNLVTGKQLIQPGETVDDFIQRNK